MTVVPSDYDTDPERWRSRDRSTQVYADVHKPVADRLVREHLEPVLDVGSGTGELTAHLPTGWSTVLLDRSWHQLIAAPGRRLHADALQLPIQNASVGAVTMLWMLYHVEEPITAIVEARRVLHRGGLFAATTASRRNDPELTDGYPPTPFDAEEAPDLVASVFGHVAIERWDAPMTCLPDREAVLRYCRSHFLEANAADRVNPPVWLTKRGCLLFATR